MKSTGVLEKPRHVSVDIVVRDGLQRHSDCGGNRVLWHQDSRDDHALSFSASIAMFGVENEMDNIPVDLCSGEARGEGIRYGEGFYQRHGYWRLEAGHDRVPQNRRGGLSRNLCDNYKPASLHFLNSIKIRSRTQPPRSATIARSLCSPAAPRTPFSFAVCAPLSLSGRARHHPVVGRGGEESPTLISSQPFAMSGQLAAVIIRSIFYSRAHLNGSSANENPSRNDSDLLPGVFCRMRVSSPHVEQHRMRHWHEHPRFTDNWSGRNERAH